MDPDPYRDQPEIRPPIMPTSRCHAKRTLRRLALLLAGTLFGSYMTAVLTLCLYFQSLGYFTTLSLGLAFLAGLLLIQHRRKRPAAWMDEGQRFLADPAQPTGESTDTDMKRAYLANGRVGFRTETNLALLFREIIHGTDAHGKPIQGRHPEPRDP